MTRTGPRFDPQRLAAGPALGVWCAIPSPLVAEALGTLGFDWICLDRQHGMIDDGATSSMIQALDGTGTPTFVRVTENGTHAIGSVLDAGAVGVVVPMVESPEDAARAVAAACYPPLGRRSWGPMRAAFRPVADPVPPDGLVLVMLETATAVERAPDILAVPGVTGVFVGPSDLAVSMGISPRDVTHREVLDRCAMLVELCARSGLVAGIGSHSVEHARAWLDMGFGLVSLGRDLSLMRDLAGERLRELRGMRPTVGS